MNYLTNLQAMMPNHIQPRFKTVEDIIAFRDSEAAKQSKRIDEMNRQARIEKILGRSGIQKLHEQCGFKNYVIETPEQRHAFELAKQYFKEFGESYGGFIFSGNVGTGKNHLATAIVRGLINSGKSAAIITVAELVQRFRSTFDKDSKIKEADLFKQFTDIDLLVLDEVGVQKQSNNDYELNLLNQIIDRRQLNLKPTGMLTNLNYQQMADLLGERIMDRQTSGGIWVAFTWKSYRSKKGGKA